jgi:hypothetical protein
LARGFRRSPGHLSHAGDIQSDVGATLRCFRQIAADLASGCALFLDGTGDCVLDVADLTDDFRDLAYGCHCTARVLLNRLNFLADVFGRFGGLLCQFLHFVSNYGEPLACFSGPGRLDGGIQGQKEIAKNTADATKIANNAVQLSQSTNETVRTLMLAPISSAPVATVWMAADTTFACAAVSSALTLKMLAREILFVLTVGPCQMNGTLALDEAHHLRHRILGRNGKQHMHMVRHQMAFQHPALLLLGQTAEDLAQMLTKTFIQYAASTFGDERHVIFTLPYGVA